MISTEAELYQLLKRKTKPDLYWTRLETSTVTGVPDCLVMGYNCLFMVELKIQRTGMAPRLSGTQNGFAKRLNRYNMGLSIVSTDTVHGDTQVIKHWRANTLNRELILVDELNNDDWETFTRNLLVFHNK